MHGYSVGCSECFHADDWVLIAFSLVFEATTGTFRFLSMLSRSFDLLGSLSALSREHHRIETVALDKGCLENICLACMRLTVDKQSTDLDRIRPVDCLLLCSNLSKRENQPQSEAAQHQSF